MTLRIISSEDVLFEGQATAVHLPGTNGEFTVLRGHATLISTLTPGRVRYSVPGESEPRSIDITGGVVDVDRDVVSVCIY